jgi:hypothetical protein
VNFPIMKWKEVSQLSAKEFRRCTGISLAVFHQMAESVENSAAKERKHPNRGRNPQLSIEDKILLLLMYYREYRTMFHIGISYGISESLVCRIIKDTETKLLQDKRFHLPGKKALTQSGNSFEIVIIDVAETPIERPKKNNASGIRAKRKGTL